MTTNAPRESNALLKSDGRSASVVKRSVLIAGHATSISLEDAFWTALKSAATVRGQSVAALVAAVDAGRGGANLSSAIRVFLLQEALNGETFRDASPPEAD